MNPLRTGQPAPSATLIGLLFGLTVGVAGAFGGFAVFIVVLALGAIGLLAGLYLDGRLDVSELGFSRDRMDR